MRVFVFEYFSVNLSLETAGLSFWWLVIHIQDMMSRDELCGHGTWGFSHQSYTTMVKDKWWQKEDAQLKPVDAQIPNKNQAKVKQAGIE